MKSGRIGLLVGVLALLLVIAWLAGVFDSNYSTLDLPEWDLKFEDVRSLEARVENDTISVVRSGGQWVMTNPINTVADSIHVRRLIDNLVELEFGSLVTANPSRYEKYGVDSSATELVVGRDGEDLQIVVGDQTRDFLGSFVRLGDDPRVFSTSRMLRLTPEVDQWRDKIVVDVPTAAVTRATVALATGGTYTLDGSSGVWRLRENGGDEVAADSAGVVRWLRRFAPLRGDGFAEDTLEAKSVAVVTFETSGGSTTALEFMETDTYLVIRRPADSALLRVSSARKTSLLPDGRTFAGN